MAKSNADRQREYRARRREELAAAGFPIDESVTGPELDQLVETIVKVQNAEIDVQLGKPPRRDLGISEGEYVRLSLAEPNILDRERAERYARWRYRGVLEGKVAGL